MDQVKWIYTIEIISNEHKYLALWKFIFMLFIIVKKWKPHTYSRIGNWFKNVYYVHVLDYYAAIQTLKAGYEKLD